MDTLAQSLEGKYEILSKIKEGGMGAIYLVRHRLLGELRVIKIMKPEVAESEEQQKRFFREAQTATRLRHQNITTFYDFVLGEDGTAYMVMEFVDGINVHDLLQSQGPAPVALAMDLSRQSLSALGYLHRKGIIHRDISPDNIMVTHDDEGRPEVKLIDLGIAKMANSQSELTAADVFVGKLRYCSPEHLNGGAGARNLDARSDLYSYGVVLYEMLTGKLPFVGDSVQALVAAQLFRPPIPIEESDPHGLVSPALRQVVMKALEKKPESRYQTADEFTRALEAAFPLTATPETRAAISQYIAPALLKSPVSRFTSSGASAQQVLDKKFGAWTTKTLPLSSEIPRPEGGATKGTRVLGSPEPATSPGAPRTGMTAPGARPSASPTIVLAGGGAAAQPVPAPSARRNPLLIPSLAGLGIAVVAIAWLLFRPHKSVEQGPVPKAPLATTAAPPAAPLIATPPPATQAATPPAATETVVPTIREEAGKPEKNARREKPPAERQLPKRAEPTRPAERQASLTPPVVPVAPPISEPPTDYCVTVLPTAYVQGVIQEKPKGFASDAEVYKAPDPFVGRIKIKITVNPAKPATNKPFEVIAQFINGGDLPTTITSMEESVPRTKGAFARLAQVATPVKVDTGDALTFYRFSGTLSGRFLKDLRVTNQKGDQWQSSVRIEPCD
jgi:serine/threonine protein kinase